MRLVKLLILKDLKLLFSDPVALLLIFVAPVVVISAAGLSLSTFYRTDGLVLPVVDEDGSTLSRELQQRLEEQSLELRPASLVEARRIVGRSPEAAALLRIPDGFGEALAAGMPEPLVLETDPVKHLEVIRVRASVERVLGAMVTVRIASRVALVQVMTATGDVDMESLSEDSAGLAETLVERSAGLTEKSVSGGVAEFNTFDQNVPGFSMTFLMLGMLFGVGLGLFDEQDWGMLYRLSATPTSPETLVSAKVFARTLVGVVQMVLLFLIGWMVFDISLGPSLPALALLVIAASFASSALGLLLAGIAGSREAVMPLGTMVIVAMAAVGGCWWPLSMEPRWLQTAAHLFPTAWAMGGFNDLMLRKRGFAELLPTLGVLFAFGVFFLYGGGALFWRRLRGVKR